MVTLKEYLRHISRGENQKIPNGIGWQTVYYDALGKALGGGVSSDLDIASRIAMAEVAERKAYREIVNSKELSTRFEINNHPTTCGFAAGFERDKVRLRAIAESLERWAWSKWIDDGYSIIRTTDKKHTEISRYFSNYFDEGIIFTKSFEVLSIPKTEFEFTVFLGIKDNGIFPGSRVCTKNENSLEHAVVEAYRHLKIHEQENEKNDFPYDRINFFAKNKDIAISQVDKAEKTNWPTFSLKLLKEYETNVENLFVYRAIAHDFIPWNEGSVRRFVY